MLKTNKQTHGTPRNQIFNSSLGNHKVYFFFSISNYVNTFRCLTWWSHWSFVCTFLLLSYSFQWWHTFTITFMCLVTRNKFLFIRIVRIASFDFLILNDNFLHRMNWINNLLILLLNSIEWCFVLTNLDEDLKKKKTTKCENI